MTQIPYLYLLYNCIFTNTPVYLILLFVFISILYYDCMFVEIMSYIKHETYKIIKKTFL